MFDLTRSPGPDPVAVSSSNCVVGHDDVFLLLSCLAMYRCKCASATYQAELPLWLLEGAGPGAEKLAIIDIRVPAMSTIIPGRVVPSV